LDVLRSIAVGGWSGPFAPEIATDAIRSLEQGKVLTFPNLSFAFSDTEKSLFSPAISDGRSKNVSLDPSGRLRGTALKHHSAEMLRVMMERYAGSAMEFATGLLPAYALKLERSQTSYRPVEIRGRRASTIRDDTRMHVDAFPSRPMGQRRILRLFTNVNPRGADRFWRIGEPFEEMARSLLPNVPERQRIPSWILAATGFVRERSPYDHLMLQLHNRAKRDRKYQVESPHVEVAFAPGSSWLCYTDQVMHAALGGQYVLEQTFHLDVDSMLQPESSPLRILERLRGHPLV